MRILLPAVIAALFASTAGAALACSCLRQESPAAHLRTTDLAFKGHVISARHRPGDTAVTTFRITEVLKGRAGETIALDHRLSSASCGLRFQRGASILVFADRDERGGWRTSLCSSPQFSEAEYRAALTRRPPAETCSAGKASFAVGKRYTENLGLRAQKAAGASSLRIRIPGRAYTEDYRTDRLNLDLDRRSRVVKAICG